MRGRHLSPLSQPVGAAIYLPAAHRLDWQACVSRPLQRDFIGAPGMAHQRRWTGAVWQSLVLVARASLVRQPADGLCTGVRSLWQRGRQFLLSRGRLRESLRPGRSGNSGCQPPSAALSLGLLVVRAPAGQRRPCACRPVRGDGPVLASRPSRDGAKSAQPSRSGMETPHDQHGPDPVQRASDRKGPLVVYARMAIGERALGLGLSDPSASAGPRRVAASVAATRSGSNSDNDWRRR